MAKVTDMVGDYADPLGDAGLNVDPEVAEGTAFFIRELLDRASQEACELESHINHDAYFAAWRIMNAVERAAFKALVAYGRRK